MSDEQCGEGRYCLNYQCWEANQSAPHFQLSDVNPRSSTYGQSIGPQTFLGDVVLLYFSWAT